MSSHKEAPAISEDPVADNTDVYAFVSPDRPNTVTLIANYVPLEDPAAGPNFSEFGDSVLYQIHVDNDGDGKPEITYSFQFQTRYSVPNTFLYNVGPIESIHSKNWNRKQFYNVSKTTHETGRTVSLGRNLACPPCNIGPSSTPDYTKLANEAIHELGGGRMVFAGQRAEGFYVDLGAVFDLGDLRPVQQLHIGSTMPASGGINATEYKNVHSIVLQVPKSDLAHNGRTPTDPMARLSTIGVWASASRHQVRIYDHDGQGGTMESGPWVQVSRLGMPLINEVIIPIPEKDRWNSQAPVNDSQYLGHYAKPELAGLLPVLYPGVFPNLDKLNKSGKPRADLEAVLLTGIPAGIVPGFQNNNGKVMADQLRLNMAIPPADNPSNLGLIGGDPAGFPNGRRVYDDVTTIELRAVAGAIYGLVDKTFTPDPAAGAIGSGITSSNTDLTAGNTVHYLPNFPYLGNPHSGFDVPFSNTPAPDTAY